MVIDKTSEKIEKKRARIEPVPHGSKDHAHSKTLSSSQML